MTRRFCEKCGKQLGPYDGWRIEIRDEKRGKPYCIESINPVCEPCATPAIAVVRSERVKEFAA